MAGISKRRVFYIGGYDPRGTRFYFPLYRDQADVQSRVSGKTLRVGACKKLGRGVSAWAVDFEEPGLRVHTDYRFLEWDAFVRRNWNDSVAGLVRRSIRMYRYIFPKGIVARIASLSMDAMYSSVCPLAFLLLALGLVLGVGVGAGIVVLTQFGLAAGVGAFLGIAGLGALIATRFATLFGIPWLLRTCLFLFEWGVDGIPDELRERLEQMADHIREATNSDPVEETIIVGHSVGAILAASVVSRLLRTAGEGELAGVKFLTLGQCIPYLSLLPKGWGLRRDIRRIAGDARIPWFDVTIRVDPLCFFLVDPAGDGKASSLLPNRPRLRRIQLFLLFSKRTYAKLRFNFLRIHFQYLMASEIPGPYDYFQITSGPEDLKEETLAWPPKFVPPKRKPTKPQ